MDALSSPFSNITASMPVASATASIAGTANESQAAAPSAAGAASPEASVRTFFSDFAQALLAAQASDPTQSIDAALAKNLLSPTLTYVAGGQLYNSAGLLQQYTTSQFLAQLQSNHNSDSGVDNTASSQGLSFFGSGSGTQSIIDLVNAYQQASLLGELSHLGVVQNLPSQSASGNNPPPSDVKPVVSHVSAPVTSSSTGAIQSSALH